MPEIANCMLSGYDVLPSEPRDFQFSNVGTNIGILHWDPPQKHADSISDYRVTYSLIRSGKIKSIAGLVRNLLGTTHKIYNWLLIRELNLGCVSSIQVLPEYHEQGIAKRIPERSEIQTSSSFAKI